MSAIGHIFFLFSPCVVLLLGVVVDQSVFIVIISLDGVRVGETVVFVEPLRFNVASFNLQTNRGHPEASKSL
jgi:hypothetical protein